MLLIFIIIVKCFESLSMNIATNIQKKTVSIRNVMLLSKRLYIE